METEEARERMERVRRRMEEERRERERIIMEEERRRERERRRLEGLLGEFDFSDLFFKSTPEIRKNMGIKEEEFERLKKK